MESNRIHLTKTSIDLVSDRLDHKSNYKTLLYLVFCFILTNDFYSLKLLLDDINFVPSEIELSEFYLYEEELTNGILSNKLYKRKLESAQELISGIVLHEFIKEHPESYYTFKSHYFFSKDIINFLVLACVCGSTKIIGLLTDHIESIPELHMHAIICDHNIESDIVEL